MTTRIGTAGWTIPPIHAGHFPGEGTHLARYAALFGAVEINSSFHRPHRRETYERWAASVPEGFRFSVKCPRTATHDLRLAACEEVIDGFTAEIAGLGSKLSVVLVQLPPSLAFDQTVAGRFFQALRQRVDATLVCEPRHASWFGEEADALLRQAEVARVAADPARVEEAAHPGGWDGIAYFRLHGSPQIYRSPYGPERCADIAARLSAFAATSKAVWCIFDNTASSAAIGDALETWQAISI